MQIEQATAPDCRAIAEVQVASWQHAYQGLFPAEYLAGLDVDRREAQWHAAVAAGQPQLLVARHDAQVQGFVAFGASRDADAQAGDGEIWALYLAPAGWSRGWGRMLWLAARDALQMQGRDQASLWVLDGNARAIAFYTAAGFTRDPLAPRDFKMGGAALRELRYRIQLRS